MVIFYSGRAQKFFINYVEKRQGKTIRRCLCLIYFVYRTWYTGVSDNPFSPIILDIKFAIRVSIPIVVIIIKRV